MKALAEPLGLRALREATIVGSGPPPEYRFFAVIGPSYRGESSNDETHFVKARASLVTKVLP